MELVEQHIRAIATLAGVEFTRQKFKAWIKDKQHPDRKKIEALGGNVFASLDGRWKWSDWRDVQQAKINGLVAVTSLANMPHHHKKQPACLTSWRRHGLDVVSVNSSEEIQALKPIYPQVTHWIECNELSDTYSKASQYINNLLNVAVELDTAILLLNSDIAIYGAQDIIKRHLAERQTTIGIRHNYETSVDKATIEPYGLDAVLTFPEVVREVAKAPYAIGRPFWDYWLPWSLMREGHQLEWIGEPLFFHEVHPLNWNQDDWIRGRNWFEDKYGERIHWAAWRESMPYPPPKNTYIGNDDVIQLRMGIGVQTYKRENVTVRWNPIACKHCQKCQTGLPEVFKPFESPWIKMEATSLDVIVSQVKECPTGAISIVEA